MNKKKIRTKYFRLKELRLSVAYMVLWSLLAVAFFTYLTIELSEKIERNPFYFIIILAGYTIIVIILSLFFTHRFLGPFERLKMQLKIILLGDYHRRLSIRSHDDLYIRSFISEVNKLLDNLEKMHLLKEDPVKKIDSELSNIKSLIERKEISREELGEAINLLHKKVDDLFLLKNSKK